MARKFFVTVIAPDRQMLLRLGEYDFDLFRQTAQLTNRTAVTLRATREASNLDAYEETDQINAAREFVIDGLLSLEEVARLVDAGYQVLVKENDKKGQRAQTEVVEFSEWLKGMEE
jgi:hypothetical protein